MAPELVRVIGADRPRPGRRAPPVYPTRSRRAAARFAGRPLAQAALRFASARHKGQLRDSDHVAFIAHPLAVAVLLDHAGQPDSVIAAGLLHDTLEKTATTRDEIQQRFGAAVAQLVESVTDDATIDDYVTRKRDLRERVKHAGADTWALFAADKITKVRELAQLPPCRLTGPKNRAKLAHYRASHEMLRRVAGDRSLVDVLEAELDVFSFAPNRTPRSGRRARTVGPSSQAPLGDPSRDPGLRRSR